VACFKLQFRDSPRYTEKYHGFHYCNLPEGVRGRTSCRVELARKLKPEILMVFLWVKSPCGLVGRTKRLNFSREDGDSTLLRNVGFY
jgi:hypothetical protein